MLLKIEINNLTKSFGEKRVLKGISMSTESGKALGLLGRNGAGKTTAMRIIMGVFPPNSGEILIDGRPIERETLKLGYLPEERGLYPKQIIVEQLIYFAMLKGLTKSKAKQAALKWLSRLEMDEYTNRRLDTLSKGNQQKIQLAAALISDPEMVILDEPFSGLDPVNAMLLKDVVNELVCAQKLVLFSSHQMNYIEEFCDDIAILNGGNIVLDGSIKKIKRSYERNKLIVLSADADRIEQYILREQKNIAVKTQVAGDVVTIEMHAAGQKNALLSALSSQEFDIDEIRVYEPSLNEIFVEYTGDRT